MDKIEMSLDEIIKTNKIGFRRGGGRGRTTNMGAGGRGRQRGGIRRGGGLFRNGSTATTTANGRSTGIGGSGVLKGRNRGAITQRSKYPRGDVNSTWKHDMYDGIKKTNRTTGALGLVGGGGISGIGGATKLIVSNLDYGVSETDIHELFADFGPLKSASVHYDRSGRSLGTADVVFERRPDAVKAMKQYNGVPLDGRPMVIQLATSELVQQPVVVVKRSMRPTISQPSRRRGVGGRPGGRFQNVSGPGGGGRASNGRQPQTKLSAEELDAELDAYVNDMK